MQQIFQILLKNGMFVFNGRKKLWKNFGIKYFKLINNFV